MLVAALVAAGAGVVVAAVAEALVAEPVTGPTSTLLGLEEVEAGADVVSVVAEVGEAAAADVEVLAVG